MNIICHELKINESLFDGNPLPDTLEDVLIFFSTEELDENNVPKHIPKLLQYIRENPDSSDEEKINRCQIYWLSREISFELNRINNNINERSLNNDDKDYYFKQKIDCLYNIFSLLINNFYIYKRMGQRFLEISRSKIDDIFYIARSGKISTEDIVYRKAVTLNYMARQEGLWD